MHGSQSLDDAATKLNAGVVQPILILTDVRDPAPAVLDFEQTVNHASSIQVLITNISPSIITSERRVII